jgi:hypothetical protein
LYSKGKKKQGVKMAALSISSTIDRPQTGAVSAGWKGLYRLAGGSAIIQVVIVVIQLVVFMSAPPPLEGTALDWFKLFQKNPIIGLIDFELLMVLYTILCIPIALALYILLRHTSPTWMVIFLALSILGVMCFIAARPAFEMLYLSHAYADAITDTQKAVLLAGGEAHLATFHGTAFYLNYILGSLTGIIISLVILRSNILSKGTAYVRIASSVCDFGLFLPVIGMWIAILSVLFLVIWDILIARRLLQIAKVS